MGIGDRRDRSPYVRNQLQQAFFCKTHHQISADDAVVKQSYVELRKHLLKALRDELVGVGCLGYETRVAMDCDNRGGVIVEH